MNTRRNIKGMLVVFIALFLLLAVYLVYIIGAYGAYWFSSPYNTRVRERQNTVLAGDIYDRNGIILAYTDDDGNRFYSADRDVRLATAHVIGDNTGQTLGAEALFSKYLLGFEQDIGARLVQLLENKQQKGADITLTVDAALCAYARSLLGDKSGAVFVMNYKTGEVLINTSSPEFDPQRMTDYASGNYNLADGSMVNRATMGRYTPGSVFKIVTAVAALRHIPGVEERSFHCDGALVFDKKSGTLVEGMDPYDGDGNVKAEYAVLTDHDQSVHGTLTLQEAFIHSCNHVFAELALEVGKDNMKKTAESLGFNGEYLFDELVAYCGMYDPGETDFNLAWSGVGQDTDIVTPVQMTLLAAAAANDGIAMQPKLLKSVHGTENTSYRTVQPEEYQTLLKGNEAAFLKRSMLGVVESGTGKKAAVEGFSVAGKTGTAEISSSGEILPHAWFTGFIDSDAHPYAITVIVERGGGGGTVAAPIAGEILAACCKK